MRDLIKSLLFKIWPVVYPFLPQWKMIASINQRIYWGNLWMNNQVQCRVEMARLMGAKVGENCRFYSLNMFSEPYLIEIGDNVIVSGEVFFVTHDGGVYLFRDENPDLFGHFGRIKVGNNCFIGMGAIILPNVEIGANCIIGAGAVVMDSIPENSVAVGNPAKVIFKTDMYRRMRLSSRATLRDARYAFPNHDKMPEDMKRKLLLEKLGNVPIRKPRK